MSDRIILVAMICITTSGMTAMVFIATYLKDKISVKSKANVKDIVKIETDVNTENKNSKN